MKTRLSTPSHNTAVEPKAIQPPQSRSTTPLLDLVVELKPARPPPTNPYHTPARSTPPLRGDTTSPTLLLVTGVDDDDHHPPPPPAPDKGTAKQRSVLCDDGNLWLTVALRATGRQTTPLTQAMASNPLRMVTLATKFLRNFYRKWRTRR